MPLFWYKQVDVSGAHKASGYRLDGFICSLLCQFHWLCYPALMKILYKWIKWSLLLFEAAQWDVEPFVTQKNILWCLKCKQKETSNTQLLHYAADMHSQNFIGIGMACIRDIIFISRTFDPIAYGWCDRNYWRQYQIHLEVPTLAKTLDWFHTRYVRALLLIYLLVDKPLPLLSCHTRVTGVRRERPLGDSWYFSVTTALSIFDQTWVLLPATVLTWIPRSRDKLSLAVSSWCFLKHPLANVATADDSHLANKSIMRKATARDEPASPVSSDIETRGQRGVTAWRVMEIRSNWSSLNYLGPHFCLNECIWLSYLESQREAHGVSQSPPLFADFRPW